MKTIGLLGMRLTMEGDFYRGRLSDRHGLEVLVADEADRGLVHDVIYRELCLGEVRDRSRREFGRIMRALGQLALRLGR